MFDVFVHDAETLNGSLHKSGESCVLTTVDAVINAITLPDSTPTSKLLKLFAERVKKSGYFFTSVPFVRQFVTNIHDDLQDSHNEFIRNMLCIDLYKVINTHMSKLNDLRKKRNQSVKNQCYPTLGIDIFLSFFRLKLRHMLGIDASR